MADNRQKRPKYPGPTVPSIDANGCLFVLAQTGNTVNVRTICPSVTNATINEAFSTGTPGERPPGQSNNTAPPLGYMPPADLQTSVNAFKTWRAGAGGKR